MPAGEKFGILILLLSLGAQLFRHPLFIGHIKGFFVFSVVGNFGSAFYISILQYHAWKGSPFSAFFLPPYRDIWYFVSYAGTRFFASLAVALVCAFALKYISEFFNRRHGGIFFEPEEGWLLALGIFSAGYPGLLLYIPLMLVAGLTISLFYHFSGKGRVPLFYAWLPVAIFAILIKSFIPASILNTFII